MLDLDLFYTVTLESKYKSYSSYFLNIIFSSLIGLSVNWLLEGLDIFITVF